MASPTPPYHPTAAPQGPALAPPTMAYPVAYAPQPMAAVPPMPPRGRSAGFWVGVATLATVGLVAALLVGFFIGRGSRLSNDAVQSKITQQSQSDQIAEQAALANQKSVFATQLASAVSTARRNAYASGRQAGFTAGQQAGYTSGQSAGFASGQASGQAQGQQAGFSQGLNQGACLANTIFCGG
jgi:hypothetical protein